MMRAKTVDEYIARSAWRNELERLRAIILKTGLEETIKWGAPCYCLKGKNVVGMASFKRYFGLWFHQGVFLSDKQNVLISASENTRGLRQWKFNCMDEIDDQSVQAYVHEAILNENAGKSIVVKRKILTMPTELEKILAQNKDLHNSFYALTPGKQREYANYIADAKQEKTKISRIEKSIPMIMSGVGLNDRYK